MEYSLPSCRNKRRICSQASGMGACFFPVHRRKGGEQDLNKATAACRNVIRRLGMIHVGTEMNHAEGWAWTDWYRIPLQNGMTLQDAVRVLDYNDLDPTVYWGRGRVAFRPVGTSTEDVAKRGKIRSLAGVRKKVKEAIRQSPMPVEVIHRMFDGEFSWDDPTRLFLSIECVPSADMEGFDVPAQWTHSDRGWFDLQDRHSGFAPLWLMVTEELEAMELAGLAGTPEHDRLHHAHYVLDRWIQSILYPPEKKK